jgi:hypothetical protein
MKLNQSEQGPPYVLDLAASADSQEVALLDRNVARILAGARAGYEACFLALDNARVQAYFRLTSAPVSAMGGA